MRGGAKTRERRAQKPEADALAVALTVQIILCVIILAGALLVRSVDGDRFARMKSEYIGLVGGGESAGMSDYFTQLTEMTGGIFASIEEFIQGLIGSREPPVPEEPQQMPEESQLPEALGMGGGGSPPASLPGFADMMPAPPDATLAPYFLSSRIRPPLEGIITSPFAFRVHPLGGGVDFHRGIDLAAPIGAGILAALPGRVERVGEDEIYGLYILISHAHNLQTFYAHASEVLVREGMRVNQGERIAKVGSTGLATGPHLHFAVIVEGLYADPLHALGRYLQVVA